MLEQNGKTWFFNSNEDPVEQLDLSACPTEKLDETRKVLYSFDDQRAESLWPSLIKGHIPIDYTINKVPEGEYETVIWKN